MGKGLDWWRLHRPVNAERKSLDKGFGVICSRGLEWGGRGVRQGAALARVEGNHVQDAGIALANVSSDPSRHKCNELGSRDTMRPEGGGEC